ncbi:hypothetical protein F5884DRAFT_881366 [Xylogone sp. PMI_703]|nr:hypothetical protein F5884DRAFT_881366 [Xylogone sp. PMI_703]
MSSYLITGTSRGLGLELVRSLVSLPASTVGKIFATARSSSPTPPLAEIIENSSGRVHFIELDVSNEFSIIAAATEVEKQLGPKQGLDVIINNAGIQSQPALASATKISDLEEAFSVNVSGVHLVTSAFLPQLSKGREKKIINISSTVGSIGLSSCFAANPFISYKVSKAALNMLTVQYAQELGPKGFTVVAVSPGWLKTDLGGSNADLPPAVGANRVVDIILNTRQDKDNGAFRDIYVEGSDLYTGQNPPW